MRRHFYSDHIFCKLSSPPKHLYTHQILKALIKTFTSHFFPLPVLSINSSLNGPHYMHKTDPTKATVLFPTQFSALIFNFDYSKTPSPQKVSHLLMATAPQPVFSPCRLQACLFMRIAIFLHSVIGSGGPWHSLQLDWWKIKRDCWDSRHF